MASRTVDFAVFGAAPLAVLLAGALVHAHKQTVCLVAEAPSAFRLARAVDLSVGPVTRPETWEMLREMTPEALKLIGRIGGRASIERLDPVFHAKSAAGIEVLAHMRQVAIGYGQPIERLPASSVLGDGIAYRLRDGVLINQAEFATAAQGWMQKARIERLVPRDTEVLLSEDGGARLVAGESEIVARQAVFVDDDAILRGFSAEQLAAGFASTAMTTVLTEPTDALFAPLMLLVDRGLALTQRAPSGITAIAAGEPVAAIANIGAALAGRGVLRRAGQVHFRALQGRDGGGVAGQLPRTKATVIASFGMTGAFLAPSLARLLVGKASVAELAYFSARVPGEGRGAVAEFAVGSAEFAA